MEVCSQQLTLNNLTKEPIGNLNGEGRRLLGKFKAVSCNLQNRMMVTLLEKLRAISNVYVTCYTTSEIYLAIENCVAGKRISRMFTCFSRRCEIQNLSQFVGDSSFCFTPSGPWITHRFWETKVTRFAYVW